MKIVPNSTITLYKDVDIGPGLMPCWSSAANRTSYFNGKKLKRGSLDISTCTCTVVKHKTGILRIEISPVTNPGSSPTGAEIASCNMLSFINPSFDNKVIYARIMDYDYVNNECVEITYMIDYFITWCFDVDYLDMYISRQHLSKADWNKAEANPYDPDILQFRTPENLPYSQELEKPCYNILNWTYDGTTSAKTDGYNATGYDGRRLMHTSRNRVPSGYPESNAVRSNLMGLLDYWGILMYITPIDWDSIGTEAKTEWEDLIRGYYVWDPDRETSWTGTFPDASTAGDIPWLWTGATPASMIIALRPRISQGSQVSVNTYKAFLDILNFLTGLGLDGQINAMYLIPYYVEDSIYCEDNGWSTINEYYQALIDSDVVKEKTSEAHDMQTSVTNKKLLNFPYSYLRVSCEDGTKEFKYENFNEVQLGGSDCKFKLVVSLMGIPRLVLIPYKYNKKCNDIASSTTPYNTADEELSNFNLDEAIVLATFPQVEFSTDGYLTFLASEYSAIRAGQSSDLELQLQLQQEKLADSSMFTAGGMLASLSNPLSAGGTLMGGTAQLEENKRQLRSLENTYARQREAQDYYSQPEKFAEVAAGENVFSRFDNTRPAHANHIFHAGASLPSLNTLKGIGNFDFTSVHVQLRPDVLAQYDKFFDLFGYNTGGKCDTPYVVNFIKGVADTTANADKLPHWATVNNKQVTYLKTDDAKVEHAMAPVANAITDMFNSGVRFINCNP